MTDHIVSFLFPFPETIEVATVDLAHRRRGLVATGKREHGVVLLTYDDSAFARSSLLLAGESDRLNLFPPSHACWIRGGLASIGPGVGQGTASGRLGKIFDSNHSLLDYEPRFRYRKNIAIEELWLSCFAYYTVLPEEGMLQERRRRARRAAAAVWFQMPSLD